MSTIQEAVAEFGAFHVLVGPDFTDAHKVVTDARDSLSRVVAHYYPEHSVYPTRVAGLVAEFKALCAVDTNTTHILYTCCPLVLNECQPAEASIVTRNAAGEVVVTRFDRTKDFARRSGAFALGELWLTFCDGDKEAQLVPE